jgi:predicted transcriptional regulator
MDVMYSLYKHWTDMILSGKKPLEFRTKLPKELKPGTKIYLYETRKHGGAGAVVGECIVQDIIPVLSKSGKWPMYGCYPFVEFFCENILHDLSMASHIQKIKEEFENKFPRYKYGYILKYVFSEDNLKNLRSVGEPIDTWKIHDTSIVYKILDNLNQSEKLMEQCDEWLEKIGFYNEWGETNYRYGLVLTNPVRYDTPIPITHFKSQSGDNITTAPQSYCYALI